ncbi:hypothetical protein PVIIG_01138 [Plasmodium vivax India VII]|uniref:PIR Superfamily Protein n=1 Tax=Plasmodium vivax India VII TaxID=1077284 RepID=A0A0J9S670_PLAVI|nr:hypothetical protein PVIIG_01138 [Plasmodium vivax India VII]
MNEYSEKIHYERHLNHMNSNKKIEAEEQIPYKFYSRLNDYEDASKLEKLNSKSAILPFVSNEECKKNLAQLARNIRLIISEYPENYVKRCRDINNWLNGKIETCKSTYKEDIYSGAIAVFNDVKWNTGNRGMVCKIEKDPYGTEHVELKKALDDYCEIRNNIRCNIFKNNDECLKYNIYIKKKKQYFSDEMSKICATPECNLKNYEIGDNCTFKNMDDTFREINCEGLYKEELKKTDVIIKGRSPLEIGFFIIVSFMLFYLFILFLEKVK